MAKNIQGIHERIRLALGKNQSKYFSPVEIDKEINIESANLFNKYVDDNADKRYASEYLTPFKILYKPSLNSSGETTLPSDFAHILSVQKTGDIPVDLLELTQWGTRVNHSIRKPETEFPIGMISRVDTGLRVLTIKPFVTSEVVDVYYLKFPDQAVFAFNLVGNDFVYDDSTAVALEWDQTLLDQIVNRVIANLGIGTRESGVVEYSQIEKQQERE